MIFDTEKYFKALATANGWGYSYGRSDYQNTYDIIQEVKDRLNNEEKDIMLYVHELNQDTIGNTVNLEILLVKDSDFKEGEYTVRNQTHILPMKNLYYNQIQDKIDCEHDFKKSILYDKINEYDKNLDGVMANIILKITQ